METQEGYKIVEAIKSQPPVDKDNDNITDNTINGTVCDKCQNTNLKEGPVNIEGCLNIDPDNDGVFGNEDECPDIPGGQKAHGCPDKDNDGIPDNIDSCKTRKGPASNKGCPVSEWTLAIDGGITMPFGSSYSEKKILNNQTSTWNNNSRLAWQGLLFNLSLQYIFSRAVGVGIGGMYFTNSFNADRLKLNTEVFLSKNNIDYNNVTVSSGNYSYTVGYVKFSLGSYWKKHNVFKLEPTVGYAFNGFAIGESLMRIDYQSGNSQISSISLKASPFPIYGGAFRIEWWPGEAHWGLSLNGYYLTGEAALTGQQINFQKTTDMLSFSNSSRLQMLGATLGVHVYLRKGKTYYKRPSDYYAIMPHRSINVRRY